MNRDHCATCGRPRGISVPRRSWSYHATVHVPRTGNPDDHPAQMANDLICSAAVYRNGGSDEHTHLCDDCIRTGLRVLKLEIDSLLSELDDGHDKDSEIAHLTARLAALQAQCRREAVPLLNAETLVSGRMNQEEQ